MVVSWTLSDQIGSDLDFNARQDKINMLGVKHYTAAAAAAASSISSDEIEFPSSSLCIHYQIMCLCLRHRLVIQSKSPRILPTHPLRAIHTNKYTNIPPSLYKHLKPPTSLTPDYSPD